MNEREKVIKGLECAIDENHFGFKRCHNCKYRKDVDHFQYVCDGDRCLTDAIALLKAQSEIIDDLIKVGYPHNFQREEPWIVNYMYAITDVIKKAVNLNNG